MPVQLKETSLQALCLGCALVGWFGTSFPAMVPPTSIAFLPTPLTTPMLTRPVSALRGTDHPPGDLSYRGGAATPARSAQSSTLWAGFVAVAAAVAGASLGASSRRRLAGFAGPAARRVPCAQGVAGTEVRQRAAAFDTSNSDALFAEAQHLMPGGVSSPVRAFKGVGGNPVVFDRVKGAYAWDVDGNRYVDYVNSRGPAIIGHADEGVLEALGQQLTKGTSFGAPCELENTLAKMVIDAVPSIEMVRFTNSGTEACMGMLRLARAFTKRDAIIKFEGCYHGHADPFLVQAGSGVATLSLPDSPGVPTESTAGTLCAQYNDLASVEALLKTNKVAAVILEAVVGNSGFILPTNEFLQGLRRLTTEYGALLVFDEVMTGFRISYGGAQQHFGVTPDLTTLGKVIGGGLPVGAFGGKKEIMQMVAPAGPMYQAGTLSGNPLAMTAGIKTLETLRSGGPDAYAYLDHITGTLVDGIVAAGREAGHAICGGHLAGMFGFFFTDGPVTCYADAAKSDLDKFGRFHRGMLKRGFYFAPSQFEAGFVCLKHTDDDVAHTIAAAREVFAEL